MITKYLNPGVYKIVPLDEHNKFFNLVYVSARFDIPKKIYGNIMKKVIRIWNDYAINQKSTGCMLIGDKGSGKTLLASLLSNLAIDNKLPVVSVSEIKPTVELLSYISSLKNCVILFDEFGKNMSLSQQDYILTMLSDYYNTQKLFIITENKIFSVNDFILDRPGRIKYRLDFNKLSLDVFEDYVKDFDINPSFLSDLEDCYNAANEFSFDQLQAIVQEHLNYPNDSLDEILNVLNTGSLRKRAKLRLISVTSKSDDNQTFNFNICNPIMQDLEQLKSSRIGLIVDILGDNQLVIDSFSIPYKSIKHSDNSKYEYIYSDIKYLVKLVEVYE